MQQEDKRKKLLESAIDVFIRHGYKRTTMTDLAEAAEMSRPAVYLLFRNKEDIFKASLSWYIDCIRDRTAARLLDCPAELEVGLRTILDEWVIKSFEHRMQSPYVQELMACKFTFAVDESRYWLEGFQSQLFEWIEPFWREECAGRVADCSQLARCTVFCFYGAGDVVTDVDDLRGLVDTVVRQMVIAFDI